VRSLENGQEKLLVAGADSSTLGYPRWSRDAQRLAYQRGGPDPRPEVGHNYSIVLADADGSSEQVLAAPNASFQLPYDWSPDGQQIVAGASPLDSPTDVAWWKHPVALWLYPISAAPHAEAARRLLTSSPGYSLWGARFSPDGRWIAFLALPAPTGGTFDIEVISVTGGEWRPVVRDGYRNEMPHWSPDGRILYFQSNRAGFSNVWGIHFDPGQGRPTGEPFRVTAFESPRRMLSNRKSRGMSVTRNKLAVPITEVSGNIWMLDGVDR
jgi:Tol biopolymer transport system component